MTKARDIADLNVTILDSVESGATADQTNAEIRAAVEAATDSNVFTDADHTKLNAIEASADVTDTTNVTAAGALMDSELTSIASVKALDQGVATGDSPTFAAVTVTGEITANGGIALADSDKATFGASDDLQIYHDGTNSYIKDDGNGDLIIQAYDDIKFQQSTDNASLVTINTGGNVTIHSGNLDVTGTATVDGLNVTSSSSNAGTFKAVGGYAVQAYQDATSADHTALELRSDHVAGGTNRYLIRGYNTAAGTPVESFKVDTAGGAYFGGDVGIGVTPTAFSSRKSLDIGLGGKLWALTTATETGLGNNFYFDGAYKRLVTSAATRHIQDSNGHTFDVAVSGAADSAISWTTAMTVDNSGNVLIANGTASSHLIGGIGAGSTGGTLDWNHASNARSGSGRTLLLGTATNGPNVTGYFHSFSFAYAASGNMTQWAIGYFSNARYMRYVYSGTWSSWYSF